MGSHCSIPNNVPNNAYVNKNSVDIPFSPTTIGIQSQQSYTKPPLSSVCSFQDSKIKPKSAHDNGHSIPPKNVDASQRKEQRNLVCVSLSSEQEPEATPNKVANSPTKESFGSKISNSKSTSISKNDTQNSGSKTAKLKNQFGNLSFRARSIIDRVDEVVSKCAGYDNALPTTEERAMFEVFTAMKQSPLGAIFLTHPEVYLSNRSAVMSTPEFQIGEDISSYSIRGLFNPGTVGRSYLAVNLGDNHTAIHLDNHYRMGACHSQRSADPLYILKVVSFVLRKDIVDYVIEEQRVLINLNYEAVLKIADVLDDERNENVIVVTSYHPKGNITQYAGKLDNDPEKYRRIVHEVGMGLRILHSHKIYHHNLKLENILETNIGTFSIADAGFSGIFLTQCPEALVLNGELACLPPEVFHPNSRYANESYKQLPHSPQQRTLGSNGGFNASMVDIWGFGLLMYRLAYGQDPFEIAECTFDEVRNHLLTFELNFPKKMWPFSEDLEDAISWCLEKNPSNRPTIIKLLRHPFFRGCMVQSFSVVSAPFLTHSAPQQAGMNMSTTTLFSLKQGRSGYTVDSLLGKGRFSETLLVHLRRNRSKQFAFKIIHYPILQRLQKETDPSDVIELKRQLAVCKKIRHPQIVYNIDIVDDQKEGCFVVQDFLKNSDWTRIPPLQDNTSGPNFRRFLFNIVEAIVCLHDNRVPHLCLTPNNILFSEETSSYFTNDYGPLFLTLRQIIEAEDKGEFIYWLPKWVSDDIRVSFTNRNKPNALLPGASLDTFCIGLLAASVVPDVYEVYWDQLCGNGKKERLQVDKIIRQVEASKHTLPVDLIDFIRLAIQKPVKARELISHRLFKDLVKDGTLTERIVQTTNEDIAQAISSKPRQHDESRMLDVLGQDPMESTVFGSTADVITGMNTFDTDTEDSSSVRYSSGVLGKPDKNSVIEFKGKNLLCGQCFAEITIAFYRCRTCRNHIRCGKCAVNDNHEEDHELAPFLIYQIQHNVGFPSKAILVQPESITDNHALEMIEMQANFPSGALTQYLVHQRVTERSTIRGTILGFRKKSSKEFNFSKVSSEASESSPPIAFASANFNDLATSISTIAPAHTTSEPKHKLGGLLAASTNPTKKLVLPKADEMDDCTWEEELERCRQKHLPELLLYSYNLRQIPRELYNPPLLHVLHIDLSYNELTSIPHELSFLVHLRRLTVSHNNLKELPDSIGNLLELEQIDVSHNQLTDLPQTFIYLQNLESLAMDYNDCACVPEAILDIMASPVIDDGSPVIDSASIHEYPNPYNSSRCSVANSGNSFSASPRGGCEIMGTPKLSIIYLASNDRITTFPPTERLRRFANLKIAFDNEPNLYSYYYANNLDKELPNVSISWNKIYPDEIIPRLYCGSLRSAQSQMVYRKLNISYVLTVGRKLVPVPPEGGKHKVIVLDDIPGADISSSFDEAISFIDESQKRGNGCLVHCFAGLSRSATTVIAYLMIRKHMRLDEAYLITKKGRPAILPNKGFFEQLITLDTKLFPGQRELDLSRLDRPAEDDTSAENNKANQSSTG